MFPERKGQTDVWTGVWTAPDASQRESQRHLAFPSPHSTPALTKETSRQTSPYTAHCTRPSNKVGRPRPPTSSRSFLPAKEATLVHPGGVAASKGFSAARNAELNCLKLDKQIQASHRPWRSDHRNHNLKPPGLPILLLRLPGSDLKELHVNQLRIHFRVTLTGWGVGLFWSVGFLPPLFFLSRSGSSLVHSSSNSQSPEIKKTSFWPLFSPVKRYRLVAA